MRDLAVARTDAGRHLLSVQDLRVSAHGAGTPRTLVAGVNLTVEAGESVAIVGESGSGKSLTARALLGLLPSGVSADGIVEYRGANLLGATERELRSIRGSQIAILFQDPYTMLNPLRRTAKHLEDTLARPHGQSRHWRNEEARRRLAEVGIRDPLVSRKYPFQLSGGMRQRVALAAALAQDPAILIADEPTTALDVTTQQEILELLRTTQEARSMALLLITHDLRVAFNTCERVYVFYAGSVLEEGPAVALRREPLHPYTLGLLLSDPPLDRRLVQLAAIPGSVPHADEVSGRCAFAPRCEWVREICTAAKPQLLEIQPNRASACVRVDAIRRDMAHARAEVAQFDDSVPDNGRAALVRVRALRKQFGGGTYESQREATVALDGVTLEIAETESVGLVGESGSGKTTLARCLVGLEEPTDGEIFIGDLDVSAWRRILPADRRLLRGQIQMVFQDPYSSLNPARTVRSTLAEALRASGDAGGKGGVERLLGQVGLPASHGDRKPSRLSGGERQRVAIARALAMNPRILVCDEPVSALDSSVQAQILNLFRSLQADLGLSYLFISHDLAVIRQIADRVYVLYEGRIVESGSVDHVLHQPHHWYTRLLMGSIPQATTDAAARPREDVAGPGRRNP